MICCTWKQGRITRPVHLQPVRELLHRQAIGPRCAAIAQPPVNTLPTGCCVHLHAYARQIYAASFRASTGLWPFWAASSQRVASYPLPVRQASALPRASFRLAVTRETLASG